MHPFSDEVKSNTSSILFAVDHLQNKAKVQWVTCPTSYFGKNGDAQKFTDTRIDYNLPASYSTSE